jgi:ethanolamine phosphate phosphodiesterase
MMHLRHVAQQQTRRLTRRFLVLRHLSIVTTLLTCCWLYVIWWGERTLFAEAIAACAWETWERWPAEAVPHRMVLVADPQLVDPHTYPGRPWPLSTATERYTDLYMARNFKLINTMLDPDSVVFLGDLFDGGREWATSKARPLRASQRKKLLKMLGLEDDSKVTKREAVEEGDAGEKRSMESYHKAMLQPHSGHVDKKDHFLAPDGRDLKAFVPGENGRWSAWGQGQWDKDFRRFSHIFFDPGQLYPQTEREVVAAYEVDADKVGVINGAKNVTTTEYATYGGKQRKVLASLPGNHDLGFGMGVQLPVRDRFEMHFGDTNRVDVIGNHTFVSVDAPSLSASGQFMPGGGETPEGKVQELEYLWQPTGQFLMGLNVTAGKAVNDELAQFYPNAATDAGYPHKVTHATDAKERPTDPYASYPQLPVILLSHVPLYREPDTDCGPLRERGRAISVSAGYQYQNVLTRSISNNLVKSVSEAGRLVQVFSGDDHDYCEMSHRYNIGAPEQPANDAQRQTPGLANVPEITVKSFSWAMGVRKPGFLLVSLWNPVDEFGTSMTRPKTETGQTHLCLLPDQLGIFIDYVRLLAMTLLTMVVWSVYVVLRYPHPAGEEDEDAVSEKESPMSQQLKSMLPRFRAGTNGSAASKSQSGNAGRHRAASTSTSSNHSHNNNGHLGVQRSYNARTRSVSPAYPPPRVPSPYVESSNGGPLIDKAGYYPQVRWSDPTDAEDESDEESHIGAVSETDEDDSQAKWKRRRRTPGRARRALGEFAWSLLLVGVPSLVWYVWLVRRG